MAPSLSHSNISPQCLLRFMPIMPWVLRSVFFFRVEPDTNLFMLLFVLTFSFCFQIPVWHIPQWGLNYWDLHHHNCLEYTHDRHMHWFMAYAREALKSFSPHCFEKGMHHATQTAVLQLFNQHDGIQVWECSRVTQSLHLPYMVERGLHFKVNLIL